MAKSSSAKGGTTKAAAIRDILSGNPKASTKDVVADLAQKGVKVSANHVYLIKSKIKGAKRRQKRQRVVATTAKIAMGNPAQAVVEVKTLARKLGGMTNLKALVDVLAE